MTELIQDESVIKLSPEGNVEGSLANFELTIENISLSKIVDIEIYENYFVAIKNQEAPINLIQFGSINTIPNTKINTILSKEKAPLLIEFGKTFDEMDKLQISKSTKGQRTKVLLIKINFLRNLDGNSFHIQKLTSLRIVDNCY